ncbi:MAG: hypothetical protein GY696_26335 [Gammaproteobacteria bacterium]|nr:hypothetical protein [Gammaproteobacteria bacterium]
MKPEIKRPVKLTCPPNFATAMERAIQTERIIGDDDMEDRVPSRSRGSRGMNNIEAQSQEDDVDDADEKNVNAVVNEEAMSKLEQERLRGNRSQFQSHINQREKSPQSKQRVQGQLRGMSNRVGACEGELTGLKAMAEEMLGYLKPSGAGKEVTNVHADEPAKSAYASRERGPCEYCGRSGHGKSRCFLDPAGEYYKPEYSKYIKDRSKKEKKSYYNILRKKATKRQCNDSSETSDEESDEDEHRAKKANRNKQKVNFANMILQSMAKSALLPKAQSGSQKNGTADAALKLGSLGKDLKNKIMKFFPGKTPGRNDVETVAESDSLILNEGLEEVTAQQRLALAEPVIPPQLNCVPQRGRDRILPRTKVLPKIAPHIEDSAKVWSEMRMQSHIATVCDGYHQEGSDSGFQSVESDEEPPCVPDIPAQTPESALWSSRQRKFNDETSTEYRTIFQCLFEPMHEAEKSKPPQFSSTDDKNLEVNLLRPDDDLTVKVPEFEINSLVDERNRRDLLLKVACPAKCSVDDRAAATRMCDENIRRMETQLKGLTGKNEELGEDPANIEIYASSKEGKQSHDPIQAWAHAEDVIMDQDSQRPDDLPVVLVLIDGEPGDMLVDGGNEKCIEGANVPEYRPIVRKRGDNYVTISPKAKERLKQYVRSARSKGRQISTILRRQVQPELEVGQYVTYDIAGTAKIQKSLKLDGPYRIIQKLSPDIYRITSTIRRTDPSMIANRCKLKLIPDQDKFKLDDSRNVKLQSPESPAQ